MAEKPVIIEGANAVYDGTKVPDFRSDDDIENFIAVYLNGKLVDPSNYVVTAGSIRVTFKDAFLRSLPAGEYVIGIESTNGVAEAPFTIEADLKPAAGTESGEETGSGSDTGNTDNGTNNGTGNTGTGSETPAPTPAADKTVKPVATSEGTPETADATLFAASASMALASAGAFTAAARLRRR